jgi:hypothetical protein
VLCDIPLEVTACAVLLPSEVPVPDILGRALDEPDEGFSPELVGTVDDELALETAGELAELVPTDEELEETPAAEDPVEAEVLPPMAPAVLLAGLVEALEDPAGVVDVEIAAAMEAPLVELAAVPPGRVVVPEVTGTEPSGVEVEGGDVPTDEDDDAGL